MAAYAAELVDDGKSMSTVRLVVSAIGDTHRRVNLESGVSETLRGPARQLGVSQKQARTLDVEALVAVRATAFIFLSHAFTLFAEHVHNVHHPTNVLPQFWHVARGPSMALPPCRHSFQTRQHRPHASLRLCSQAIVLMYSSA